VKERGGGRESETEKERQREREREHIAETGSENQRNVV